MYELFTNMFMYIYILGPVTASLPCSTTISGYRSGIGLMLRASDWFLSGAGIVRYVAGLLPCTMANPVHEFTVNNT